MNMKLNENINRIKEVMGINSNLNEEKRVGNRIFYDEEDCNKFERVLNRHMSTQYEWWRDIEIIYMIYDVREKMLSMTGKLYLNEEWFNSLDNETKEEVIENDYITDFPNPQDGYGVRDNILTMFDFMFGLKVNSIMDGIRVKFPTSENIQEQETPRKDLSTIIEKLLERIKDDYPDIICNIEVTAPWNRESTEFEESFESYEILMTLVGGYGSNRWPNTQAILAQNEDVITEVWNLVYDFFGLATDIYIKNNPRC
jgi:hypothetical protein